MVFPLPNSLSETTTAWVRLFRWLGRNAKFPPPNDSDENVRSFVQTTITIPVIIIVLGFLIAFVLFVYLCCCHRANHRNRPVKPSSKPVLILAIVAFAVMTIATFGCWATGGQSFNTAKDQLSHAVVDLKSATTQGNKLNATGSAILKHLDLLYASCPAAAIATLKAQLDPTVKDLKTYIAQINQYTAEVAPLASKLHDVHSHSKETGALIASGLALPMLLVGASCIIIFLAVLATRGCGGSGMAKCNDCCLIRLGSLFIASSVFLAAAISGSEMYVGVVTGVFCTNADANVLSYAKNAFGNSSVEYEAASYYIIGAGVNPLNKTLFDAGQMVRKSNKTFMDMEQQYGTLIQSVCNGWTATEINQGMHDISADIAIGLQLVNVDNIYPYYDEIIHEDMCETVVGGLGWLVVCQLLVGLLCLPALAMMSASFFTRWAVWKETLSTGFLAAPEVYVIDSVVEAREVRNVD